MPRKTSTTSPSRNIQSILVLSLLFIVLCSTLGLDFIHWKRGEKSYIFFLLGTASQAEMTRDFNLRILDCLSSLGIQADVINHPGKSEKMQIPISMSDTDYEQAAVLLERELRKAQIFVKKTAQTAGTGLASILWDLLGGHPKQSASLIFTLAEGTGAPLESADHFEPKNRVALIIDDMGNSLNTLKTVADLGLSLTIAILPHTPWAEETARIAQQYEIEVILHLPLESLNDIESNTSTKGLIHAQMTEQVVLDTLEANLSQVPFIRGVNNHMGSKITAMRDRMSPILSRLKEAGLYFVDSVTAGNSIAFQLAQEMSIPSAYRDVFLDSETDEGYIRNQLIQLLRLAQNQGMAVGICHPYAPTLKVLSENLDLFAEYDCKTVFVSEIVK